MGMFSLCKQSGAALDMDSKGHVCICTFLHVHAHLHSPYLEVGAA